MIGEKQMDPNNLPQCTRSDGVPKKSFVTSSAADSFARDYHLKNPQTVLQSAYACEDCPYFHVSSTDAASHALTKVDYDKAGLLASPPGLHQKYAHHQSKIKELYTRGVAISDISKQLDVPYSSLYVFLTETGLHKPDPQRSASAQTRRGMPTIESIDTEAAALVAKLKELEAKKVAIIEAKALKITNTIDNNGVIIRKEGASMALSFQDALDLVYKLNDYLAENAPELGLTPKKAVA
jgi:hypothetical protein